MKLMKLFCSTIILSLLMPWTAAEADKSCRIAPIRIGVIDTGFGYQDRGHGAHLCKYGHKDFSITKKFTIAYDTKTLVPLDEHGHGTNVAGLIEEYASKGHNPYCLVILKYYSEAQTGTQNKNASVKALQYANNLKLDVINYSGGGPEADDDERIAVLKLLAHSTKLIFAAGNDGQELSTFGTEYYPAMYSPKITVVGNKNIYGKPTNTSNYGSYVNTWEFGENQTAYGITMSGTSQATAITTGKTVAAMSSCDR